MKPKTFSRHSSSFVAEGLTPNTNMAPNHPCQNISYPIKTKLSIKKADKKKSSLHKSRKGLKNGVAEEKSKIKNQKRKEENFAFCNVILMFAF